MQADSNGSANQSDTIKLEQAMPHLFFVVKCRPDIIDIPESPFTQQLPTSGTKLVQRLPIGLQLVLGNNSQNETIFQIHTAVHPETFQKHVATLCFF